MRFCACLLLASALIVAAHADTLLRESFEKPGRAAWEATWGPALVSDERAQDGQKCLKETLEDKYGLSVYSLALPVYPRT
ncbi:MAG: hypothetical protein WCP21_09660, partial [Armatimonadota bacterium]